MTDFINISSGFIIPKNDYYRRIIDEKSNYDELFKRTQFLNKDFLTEFFTKYKIYTSDVVNDALYNYMSTKSSKDFYRLVDIAYEIFNEQSLKDFFKLQARNPFLSAICYTFIIDLLKEFTKCKIDETVLNRYTYVPYNIRFNFNTSISNSDVYERTKEIETLLKIISYTSNIDFFIVLLKNKNNFLTFYKFVLADIY